MRIKNSPKTPPKEFFREQRLRANNRVKPHLQDAEGRKFIIAPNGIRIPLLSAEKIIDDVTRGEGSFLTVCASALRAKAVKLS